MQTLLCVMFWPGTAAARADSSPPVILVMGDSLSAAYGIPQSQGWVALLQQRLQAQGYPHRVVNASISGETTSGGLRRLPPLLEQHRPQLVLIELGANDGLRGLPLPQMRSNLQQMAALSRKAGARPVLFEMRLPTNYGAYADRFQAVFPALAKAEKLPLVPFFLMPIALDPAFFLDDGLHPAASAQPKLLEAVWPSVRPLLQDAKRLATTR